MIFIQERFYESHTFPCQSLLLSTTILIDMYINDIINSDSVYFICVLVICCYYKSELMIVSHKVKEKTASIALIDSRLTHVSILLKQTPLKFENAITKKP